MARIEGPKKGRGLLGRFAYFYTRRKVGRVIPPVQVHARHNWLLFGYGQMEVGQEKATRVAVRIKSLASIRVAMRVGCPF